MPYIKQERRSVLDEHPYLNNTVGELNYVITRLATVYIDDAGNTYASINEVIGVLECAKLELYRRIAAPYENSKCEENGDVY